MRGHKIWEWRYDKVEAKLYHLKGVVMDVYTPSLVPGHVRCANRWTRSHLDQPRIDIGTICTMQEVTLGVMTIILFGEGPPTHKKPTKFWEVLRRWQCTWMWENLQWVGDDHWIAEAIDNGTLMVVTDGSYMKDLYPNIHLAVLVLECTKGHGQLWCSFPEASEMACSYRGKLVGLMAIHLILLSVNEVQPKLKGLVHIYSDCLGTLNKVKNLPPLQIPSSWAHLDVLKNILFIVLDYHSHVSIPM